MTVTEFANKHSLNVLCLADGDREICGGYAGDLLSWVMGRARENDAWVTIMSNSNIIAVASLTDVSCIVLAEGVTLENDVLQLAQAKGINVLSSEADIYNVSAMLYNDLL